jgi:hypothetical protein
VTAPERSREALRRYRSCPGGQSKCSGHARPTSKQATFINERLVTTVANYHTFTYIFFVQGQTMDQVLFSEPSTKMKESMDRIRAEEVARVISNRGQVVDSDTVVAAESKSKTPEEDAAKSAAEKLLEERFGKQ